MMQGTWLPLFLVPHLGKRTHWLVDEEVSKELRTVPADPWVALNLGAHVLLHFARLGGAFGHGAGLKEVDPGARSVCV